MPGALRAIAVAVLLAGPTAVAFFSGGFFDEPRLVAATVAWALVLVVVATVERPLPGTRSGRLALAGLAGLTALTGLSLLWAPLSERATDDLQRDLLYLGAFVAAAALLRPARAARAVEPALAAGTLIVIGYGLSERLLPGIVDLATSASALGRLEQPLTYWNAIGALAAIGLVLCARLAGDLGRPGLIRAAALGASPVLGAGAYLSFSRGALIAVAVGLVATTVIARDRPQLRASLATLGFAIAGALACGAFAGVRALEGAPAARERDGLVALVLLLGLTAGAAALALRAGRGDESAERISIPPIRRLPAIGLVLVLTAGVAVTAWVQNRPGGGPAASGPRTERLGSLQSNRYGYWKVALEAAASRPLAGVGAGGFRVEWRRKRTVDDPSSDAHSLYLETAAELGLAGLALLAALFAGVVGAARRLPPAALAGPAGVLLAWAVHAGLDWDWEMPAVTLLAVALAGLTCARAECT